MPVFAYGAHAGDTPAHHSSRSRPGRCADRDCLLRYLPLGPAPGARRIRAEQINEAYERMLQGDVKYRFVIDNATLAE